MKYRDESFEWDVDKSETNLRKHRCDFVQAKRAFDDERRVEAIDDRVDYGEERCICIGVVDRELITVVYTWRGRRRRLISAWYSDDEDRYEYFKALS